MIGKSALALCAAILSLAPAAHAQTINGAVVTKIKALGITNPNCLLIQINGDGARWYGLPVDQPTSDDARDMVKTSRVLSFPISFNVAPPSVDCANSQTIYGVTQ
jgi:hypothetical protein